MQNLNRYSASRCSVYRAPKAKTAAMWRKIVILIDRIVDTAAARSATRNTQEYATPSLNSLCLYTKCSSRCRNVPAPMADAPEVRPSEGDLEVLYIYEQPTQRNDSYRLEIPLEQNRTDE